MAGRCLTRCIGSSPRPEGPDPCSDRPQTHLPLLPSHIASAFAGTSVRHLLCRCAPGLSFEPSIHATRAAWRTLEVLPEHRSLPLQLPHDSLSEHTPACCRLANLSISLRHCTTPPWSSSRTRRFSNQIYLSHTPASRSSEPCAERVGTWNWTSHNRPVRSAPLQQAHGVD